MGTLVRKAEFSHFDDCKPEGCPKHLIEVTFQSTSNAWRIRGWNGQEISLDQSELEAIIKAINSMYKADSTAIDIQEILNKENESLED